MEWVRKAQQAKDCMLARAPNGFNMILSLTYDYKFTISMKWFYLEIVILK